MSPAPFKPLRNLPWWIALWALAVLLVIVACLVPSADLPRLPEDSDKLEHALAWFLLAASAVQLFRRGRALCVVAVALLGLGVAIEVAQALLTTTRSADVFDVLADGVGLCIGMATAFSPLRDLLLRWQPRR